ncbi:hypothetical protein A3E45_02485 [Candidatus Daviesbacteria bacterium RIFCSPHIGHO2_12_FULL_43_11]|uniref:Uncharacterized protein n=1 Tax=Candidatus Daviesbacteria bacterium RIFCSPHIGHO2_12_FULL_43_11 TaxID=1797780 RepID=A0A1F5K1N6_9BACT|nr:MAG: hypothetical protein A3E45_02485 [Candidatus Daviesbacteria bacterium RIFCSPHIGHO2_12_FULL_43_11]
MKENLGKILGALGPIKQASEGAQTGDQCAKTEEVPDLRHISRSPFDSGVQANEDRAECISYDPHGFVNYRGLYRPR